MEIIEEFDIQHGSFYEVDNRLTYVGIFKNMHGVPVSISRVFIVSQNKYIKSILLLVLCKLDLN